MLAILQQFTYNPSFIFYTLWSLEWMQTFPKIPQTFWLSSLCTCSTQRKEAWLMNS